LIKNIDDHPNNYHHLKNLKNNDDYRNNEYINKNNKASHDSPLRSPKLK
jgi:hypothetical protein